MIRYFIFENGKFTKSDLLMNGCWISVVAPTKHEIKKLVDMGVDIGFICSSLDEEESSRIECDKEQTLIIVDTPVSSKNSDNTITFYTLPVGIIITNTNVITITSKHDTQIIKEAENGIIRNLNPELKTRFVLQILLKIATMFLFYLKQIDKLSSVAEQQLHNAMKNELIMQLLSLEKALVYFSTSLKTNELTLEKINRGRVIKLYDDDQELLEDVLIEMKQAIEMASIYSGILSSMTDSFSSVISNNLNIVMWRLTIVTILMQIPNIIFAFYGINTITLPVPYWWFSVIIASFLTIGCAYILLRRKNNK